MPRAPFYPRISADLGTLEYTRVRIVVQEPIQVVLVQPRGALRRRIIHAGAPSSGDDACDSIVYGASRRSVPWTNLGCGLPRVLGSWSVPSSFGSDGRSPT